MHIPAFSIVITTVNRPDFLLDAIQSVLAQSFADFELVVVNDGGPGIDSLLAELDPLRRIVSLRLPGKSGPGQARNRGAAVARGRHIGFLDDDDLLYPDHLATLHAGLLETPEALVYADAVVFHEIARAGKRHDLASASPWKHETFLKQRLWVSNFIPVQTFAVTRAAFLACGGFDEELRAFEDWDLLLKLAARHDFHHLPRSTSEIRMRPALAEHRSSTVKRDGSEAEIVEFLYRRHGDLGDPLVRLGRQMFRANGFAKMPDILLIDSSEADSDYQSWLARFPRTACPDLPAARSLLLVVLARTGRESWLEATLSAFARVAGPHRLMVVAEWPETEAPGDSRVAWHHFPCLDDHAGLCAILNSIVETEQGEWLALIPAGTSFEPSMAAVLAEHVERNPGRRAWYSDHDMVIHPQEIRTHPAFKPDFDADLQGGEDYIGPALWLDRATLRSLGGLQPLPGAWMYDALWRLHDRFGADTIGHICQPLFHLPLGDDAAPLHNIARQASLEQHLARAGSRAQVVPNGIPGCLKMVHPLPSSLPRISVILGETTVRGAAPLRCISSLAEHAAYGDLEIIATELSEEEMMRAQAVCAGRGIRFNTLSPSPGLSPTAACNLAAGMASGTILLFLSAATEAIEADCLSGLARQALRPEVGAVGAKLASPADSTIVDGGILIGPGMGTTTAFAGMRVHDSGPLNRLQLPQAISAVSRRCLMMRRDLFSRLGGLDAEHFPDSHADTDLGLRLTAQGLRNIWNPEITFLDHAAPETRIPAIEATDRLLGRWGAGLARDPAYNPNLSLLHTDFRPEGELHRGWPDGVAAAGRPPRVLAYLPSNVMQGRRVAEALTCLDRQGRLQVSLAPALRQGGARPCLPGEIARLAPDVVYRPVIPSLAELGALTLLRRHFPGLRLVLCAERPPIAHEEEIWRRLLGLADAVVADCDETAEVLRAFFPGVAVIPDALADNAWGSLSVSASTSGKPRLGWMGGKEDQDDLRFIAPLIQESCALYDWVVMGDCLPELRPFVTEYHPDQAGLAEYPGQLARLSLDLALVPRRGSVASTRDVLEYSALGIAILASDRPEFRSTGLPLFLLPNRLDAWRDALRTCLDDSDARRRTGDEGKAVVCRNHLLSQHSAAWFRCLAGHSA